MKLVLSPARSDPAIDADLLARIRSVAPDAEVVVATDDAACQREIVDADAFYGNITREALAAATRLRWIQSPNIGQERYMFAELASHPSVMTNPRGIFSDDIADHAMTFVLTFARGFHRYYRHQQNHVWAKPAGGGYPTDVIHLPDSTMGVVGLGGIGYAVATRSHAFGMRVLAVDARQTERPPELSELWPPSRLGEMLGMCEFVVICAPETPETRGLFDADLIARMKPSGYLINIARGKIVKLDDLVQALRGGILSGAGLDVADPEPLPPDHPLWDMPNVIITPHVAGAGPHSVERLHAILLENLRRFVDGSPLINVVDKDRWY